MNDTGFDYDSVPGDYQFRVMSSGPGLQRFWHRNKIRVVDQVIEVTSCDCVAEVGCGAGNLILHFGSRAGAVIGIDISREALRFCKRRASIEGINNALFLQSSGYAVSLADNSVDELLFVEVIEHLQCPRDFLGELYRVLRPGGKMFVTTPNYCSFWPVLEWTLDLFGLTPKMVDEQHISRFTPRRLAAVLRSAGFQITRLGTFYILSPLVQFVSSSFAARLSIHELGWKSRMGLLIYCLATKPDE
jgi:ubiquinone/menaquinone biosynthesis C-methylase UbiE